jgi:hypothetical protein
LEEQVQDKKKIVQQVCDKKIQHESYLAFKNVVIEELEAEIDEINKKGTSKQNQGPYERKFVRHKVCKIKEPEVLIEKLIRYIEKLI